MLLRALCESFRQRLLLQQPPEKVLLVVHIYLKCTPNFHYSGLHIAHDFEFFDCQPCPEKDTYLHTCMHTYIHKCVSCVCIYRHWHRHLHRRIHIHEYTYICIYASVYVYIYIHVYIYMIRYVCGGFSHKHHGSRVSGQLCGETGPLGWWRVSFPGLWKGHWQLRGLYRDCLGAYRVCKLCICRCRGVCVNI